MGPGVPKSKLDETSLSLLKLQLDAGEQLLWAGKPHWWRDRLPLVIGVIAMVPSLVWIVFVRIRFPRYGEVVPGVSLILYYLTSLALALFTSYNRDRDSLFALTDRRAIRMWPIHCVPYVNDRGEPVSIRKRWFGRLTIGDTNRRMWNGGPRAVKPGIASFLDFFAIPHLNDVLRIAIEAQQRELPDRSGRPAA